MSQEEKKEQRNEIFLVGLVLSAVSFSLFPILFAIVSFIISLIMICRGKYLSGSYLLLTSIIFGGMGATIGYYATLSAEEALPISGLLILVNVCIYVLSTFL